MPGVQDDLGAGVRLSAFDVYRLALEASRHLEVARSLCQGTRVAAPDLERARRALCAARATLEGVR